MGRIFWAAKRSAIVIGIIGAVILGTVFAITIANSSGTRECLKEGQRATGCGVELLEQIDELPRDTRGAQRTMIAFSGSVVAAAPEARRARLEGALATVYPQINDETAECFRNAIYDEVGVVETNRLAMAVGLQYIEFAGAISNLERPLMVILSEFDPTGDLFAKLLKAGMSASDAEGVEAWAYMHSAGC